MIIKIRELEHFQGIFKKVIKNTLPQKILNKKSHQTRDEQCFRVFVDIFTTIKVVTLGYDIQRWMQKLQKDFLEAVYEIRQGEEKE